MTEVSKARTQNYLKQLKGSAFFKLGAILSTFIAMPIMIKYLGVEVFGIWATMLTLISWIMLFDLGIGNGLKNKISESLAQDDIESASSFISTAYVIIAGVSLALFLVFLLASNWLPWQTIFNTDIVSEVALKDAVITLSFFVFFNFWISLVNQIYHGLQKSSVVVLGQFISNILALAFIYALYLFTEPSIVYMVWAYGISLVIANMLLTAFLFNEHRGFKPTIRMFDSEKIRPLLSLGIKFFVIQLAVLMLFMTDKILITQLLGPAEVAPYEVLFKLFSVFTVLHTLILIPLWPAYSDAYERGDFIWIRTQIKKQILIGIGIVFGAFVFVIIGPVIVAVWIGELVTIPKSLYFMFALFIAFSVWSNVFAYFVNSIGRLSVQLSTAVVAALLNVPLSIIFVKVYGMGLEGIVLATVISLSIYSVLGPIQVFRILRREQ